VIINRGKQWQVAKTIIHHKTEWTFCASGIVLNISQVFPCKEMVCSVEHAAAAHLRYIAGLWMYMNEYTAIEKGTCVLLPLGHAPDDSQLRAVLAQISAMHISHSNVSKTRLDMHV
jgi:hypothetical protein